MYFLSENMFFLRIVQDIDIIFEIPKRMDTVFSRFQKRRRNRKEKEFFLFYRKATGQDKKNDIEP